MFNFGDVSGLKDYENARESCWLTRIKRGCFFHEDDAAVVTSGRMGGEELDLENI